MALIVITAAVGVTVKTTVKLLSKSECDFQPEFQVRWVGGTEAFIINGTAKFAVNAEAKPSAVREVRCQ